MLVLVLALVQVVLVLYRFLANVKQIPTNQTLALRMSILVHVEVMEMEKVVFLLPLLHALEAQGLGHKLEHVQGLLLVVLLVVFLVVLLVVLLVVVVVVVSSSLVFVETSNLMAECPRFLLALG